MESYRNLNGAATRTVPTQRMKKNVRPFKMSPVCRQLGKTFFSSFFWQGMPNELGPNPMYAYSESRPTEFNGTCSQVSGYRIVASACCCMHLQVGTQYPPIWDPQISESGGSDPMEGGPTWSSEGAWRRFFLRPAEAVRNP